MRENFNKDGFDFNDLAGFRGEMVGVFEKFCEDNMISIANNEKVYSDTPTSNIFGTDYDRIASPVEQYVLGSISKEEISVRMTEEFLKVLMERGCFVSLHKQLEDTITYWTTKEHKEIA